MTERRTPPRPRPLSMRPAWQMLPEAQPGYQYPLPRQALANPNTVPIERRPTLRQRQFREQAYADTMRNELGRNEVNTPSNAYFGQDVLEMTGAPALSRSFDAIAAGDPGRAMPEAAMGALGILGTATLPLGSGRLPQRAMPRAPMPEPMPSMNARMRINQSFEEPTNFNRNPDSLEARIGVPEAPGQYASTGWASGVTQGNENALYVWAHDRVGNRGGNPLDGPFNTIEEAQRAASQIRSQGRWPHVSVGRDAGAIPPNPPARLPGRATDGSVLPIRPPEPFRNSMRGGSDDLLSAARAPDAGSGGARQVLEGDVFPPNNIAPRAEPVSGGSERLSGEMAGAARRTRGLINIGDILLGNRQATAEELAMMSPEHRAMVQEIWARKTRPALERPTSAAEELDFETRLGRALAGLDENAPDGGASGGGATTTSPRVRFYDEASNAGRPPQPPPRPRPPPRRPQQ